MPQTPVNIVVNVQFGDLEKLLGEYLDQLEEGEREAANNELSRFIYWVLKHDLKKGKS